ASSTGIAWRKRASSTRATSTCGTSRAERARLFPPEQLLQVAFLQLHPGRPAVIALAAMRSGLHFTEQGVHFGDRERAAGADAAVARYRRGDLVEPFLERERLVEGGEFVRQIPNETVDIAIAEHRRGRAHQHRRRAEAFEV